MIEFLKKYLYFPLAWYFRFFASIRLRRWHPRIIVVTGSNGKTTLLHMLESQIGEKAKYSHHANTSYGIPFDILGLHRKTLRRSEWFGFFLSAPFLAFKKPPREKLYVVEADAYRPGVGAFIGKLLRPEVVLWVSVSRTHSMNFDSMVVSRKFKNVEEAIAYEYGFFLAYCSQFAVINGDLPLVVKQIERTKARVIAISKKESLEKYDVTKEGTTFTISGKNYHFPSLLPEDVFFSIQMCKELMKYLDLPFDTTFADFTIPPGRGTVLHGIKNTSLIDSTYNGNLGSILVMLAMFEKIVSKKKWVVLGDMLELGNEEKEEHEELGVRLSHMGLQKNILVGERVKKYTAPKLKQENVFVGNQKEALEYLRENIKGDEVILFKGSQSLFLEGIIGHLLANKKDLSVLPRRGAFWDEMRKKRGL